MYGFEMRIRSLLQKKGGKKLKILKVKSNRPKYSGK